MTENDKYADEMLTDDELDFVVGGTRAETYELLAAIYKRANHVDISDLFSMNPEDYMAFKQVLEDELKSFRITAKADVGLNGTGEGEKANEYYTPKGNKITHAQLMNIFNK